MRTVKPTRAGWLLVYGGLALIAITALVLAELYRERPKATEVINRKRRAAATQVTYAVVFSRVDEATSNRVLADITRDLGADTITTDLVIGSTVADPWCASMGEFRRQLRQAMTASRPLPIGKQTLILSMITGLLTRSDLPARVYLIGALNAEELTDKGALAIVGRTEQTAAAMSWRHGARAPMEVVSYMDTTANAITSTYLHLFENQAFALTKR
jgi:hypothetical protein